MSAKEEILSRITSALRDAPAPEPIPREYRVSSDMPEAELIELLVDRLEDYKAHVDVVDLPHLPATLAERLKDATSFVVPHGIDAEWLVEAAPTDSARLRTDAPGCGPERDRAGSYRCGADLFGGVHLPSRAPLCLDGNAQPGPPLPSPWCPTTTSVWFRCRPS
ncbi:hypothetical protein B879_04224 [Cecembia lonarensis LW9]|uniref:Lactate utilization protein C n=1 Tax=Cecembia lonarensis (strain CCUG 58316 / KCTC 22772 / LW9) TaxID=1225176 RepID=K1L9V3_CECL9|nr:hypothetical protein B879_04224 [Cecembia lonarensis LW9]